MVEWDQGPMATAPQRHRAPLRPGALGAARRLPLDSELPELAPAGALDRRVDDPRGLLEVRRELGPRPGEVVGLHVRGGRVVLERLEQDVLLRVVEAA